MSSLFLSLYFFRHLSLARFLSLSLSLACSLARAHARAFSPSITGVCPLSLRLQTYTRPALIGLFAACSIGCTGHAADQHSLLYISIRQRMCTHARRHSRGPRGISAYVSVCARMRAGTVGGISTFTVFIYHLQLAPVLFPSTSAYVSIRPRMCMRARRHCGRTSVAVSSVY